MTNQQWQNIIDVIEAEPRLCTGRWRSPVNQTSCAEGALHLDVVPLEEYVAPDRVTTDLPDAKYLNQFRERFGMGWNCQLPEEVFVFLNEELDVVKWHKTSDRRYKEPDGYLNSGSVLRNLNDDHANPVWGSDPVLGYKPPNVKTRLLDLLQYIGNALYSAEEKSEDELPEASSKGPGRLPDDDESRDRGLYGPSNGAWRGQHVHS